MATVKVEKNNYTVEPLYQWDLNQQLEIYGLSLASVPEIHFTNAAMSRAIVRQATMDAAGVVRVDVPNSLLQKPYTIQVYVCTYAGSTFETQYKLEIPVKARTQPADYELVDDPEVYSFNALENQVVNALAACEGATAAYKAAETAYKNAKREVDEAVANAAKTAVESLTPQDIGALLPQIIVTAPTGLTVTCTMGDSVLTAPEVNGVWMFDVPEYGEWTVNQNGELYVSLVVDAVKQYRVEVAEQSVNYTMLYDAGDECTDISGGWSQVNGSSDAITKNSDSIRANVNGQYKGSAARTVNKVAIAENSILGVCANVYNGGFVGVSTLAPSAEQDARQLDVLKHDFTTNGIANADISALTEDNYVGIGVDTSSTSAVKDVTFKNVYLAKADPYRNLAEMAGLSMPSDATISDLLNYSETLLNNSLAVTYMVRACTGSFMVSAIASETFLTALSISFYKETVYANEHWAKFLAMVA